MLKLKLMLSFTLIIGITGLFAQAPYGVGDNLEVPYVAPGTLTLDGNADEAA